MALTAFEVKRARHSGGNKPDKIQDGAGLILLIYPSGAKSWRLRYTFRNVRPEITLGQYPAMSLSLARKKAAEIRTKIAEGIDPRADKEKLKCKFATIAKAWWAKQSPAWSADYAKKVQRGIEQDLAP
ncbi:MAG: Arm DNA-binding domain-containing protein, partial [Mariprofundales bacterium]|nr:Arm DNA-binding domain-containing protein [Mariprofundales bacterium]